MSIQWDAISQKKMMQKFGLQTDIEDIMLLLSTGPNPNIRRIDDRKRKQLVNLYTQNLSQLMSYEEELSEIIINKVEVPQAFTELRIYWRCSGDVEKDQNTECTLMDFSNTLRRKLSESLYGSNVPRFNFIPDRSDFNLEEMNKLFEAADYGAQYRTVSKTGEILGSLADSGIVHDSMSKTDQKIPRWLQEVYRKKKEKKASLAKTQVDDDIVIQDCSISDYSANNLNVKDFSIDNSNKS